MEQLYLKDCYLTEFDAVVKSIKDDKYVVLNKTAFYSNSGGQPSDTGVLIHNDQEYPVAFVGKIDGIVSHEISVPGLKPGDKIKGIIDWDKRYNLMKYHTASHILSAIIHNETDALISGNQIGKDKTRIDFSLEDFDRELIKSYEAKVNDVIDRKLPVKIEIMPRDKALNIPTVVKLKDAFPPDISEIRVITIQDIDQQACGGTHVANTSEIPHIDIFKTENKGKNNRRLHFKFV
ncbi:MAG: alanyl-tRNA editing protein AlaXM [Methanosarcinaceae archaeon]|nr:alanyl-tRNA editing protein AlaXM [Methanosarcinaceae archaeon]MDF1533577.1 alanyl-tRNA editing protein AlaXM [Methanosarcinaceae archaeon]